MALIFTHIGSCNLGDKYQLSPSILRKLEQSYESIEIVNFIDFDGKLETPDFCNHLTVRSPSNVLKEDKNWKLILFLTGSFDEFVTYYRYIKHFVYKCERFILWGGFTRGYSTLNEFRSKLLFFNESHVEFWARSFRDLLLYKDMNFKFGRLAGDPVGSWIFDDSQLQSFTRGNHYMLITSIYAHKRDPEMWDKIYEMYFPYIFYIDSSENEMMFQKRGFKLLRDPSELIKHSRLAKAVVSTRFHGGLLASLVNVPTVVINIDNCNDGLGCFKFNSIGFHAMGWQQSIMSVINLDIFFKHYSEIELFLPNTTQFTDYIRITENSIMLL